MATHGGTFFSVGDGMCRAHRWAGSVSLVAVGGWAGLIGTGYVPGQDPVGVLALATISLLHNRVAGRSFRCRQWCWSGLILLFYAPELTDLATGEIGKKEDVSWEPIIFPVSLSSQRASWPCLNNGEGFHGATVAAHVSRVLPTDFCFCQFGSLAVGVYRVYGQRAK